MPRMTVPSDDDEFRKRITALALGGDPHVLLDNLDNRPLGCPGLSAALTGMSWNERILGQSAMTGGIPLYMIWYATGNNITLADDTARRTVHIRIVSPDEKPEERSGFLHPDLLGWITNNRPQLVSAALTILSGYYAVGRPDMRLRPWGSYEGWSDLVRSAVTWIGLEDPGSTRAELADQSDGEYGALRQLLEGWHEVDSSGRGLTVAELLNQLAEHPYMFDAVREALDNITSAKDAKTSRVISLGRKFHRFRGRNIGGRCLDGKPNRTGTIVWRVHEMQDVQQVAYSGVFSNNNSHHTTCSSAGDAGDAGVNFNPRQNLGHAETVANRVGNECVNTPQLGAESASTEKAGEAGNIPCTPCTPAICHHTPHTYTTFDGWVRTECSRCHTILEPDQRGS